MKAGRKPKSRTDPDKEPLKPTRFDFGVEGSAHIAAFLKQTYDQYRTSLLNVKYYGYRLQWARGTKRSVDIIVAISMASGLLGTISGLLAGWAVWNMYVLPSITGAGGLLHTVKPRLPFNKRITLYSRFYSGHMKNYLELKAIVERIAIEQGFSHDMERSVETCFSKHRALAAQDPDLPKRRLVNRFQSEIELQLPAEGFWWPK